MQRPKPRPVTRKTLNRRSRSRPNCWRATLIEESPRAMFSLVAAALSLWTVYVCQGIELGRGDVTEGRGLSVEVLEAPSDGDVGRMVRLPAFLEKYKLHVVVRLQATVWSHPPGVIGRFIHATNFENERNSYRPRPSHALLVLEATRAADNIPSKEDEANIFQEHELEVELVSSRKLLEHVQTQADSSEATVVYRRLTDNKDDEASGGLRFEYDVKCPLSVAFRGGNPWRATYICPLEFEKPLDASKGLAQVRWVQSLSAQLEEGTATQQTVAFDSEFDDVKAIPFADYGKGSDVEFNWSHVHRPAALAVQSDSAPSTAYSNVGFLLQGTNGSRKDVSDFISWGMAAVFGAAAASIFEQFSRLLRRTRESRD